jgi:ribonuclease Z
MIFIISAFTLVILSLSHNNPFGPFTFLTLQLQVQKTGAVRPSKITKIFVSHSHGDHSFGIPGLLCLMGQDRDRETSPPVDIYGPEGLRMWLRVAIRYSVSRIVPPYRVHEIMDVPMAPEWEFNKRSRRYFYRGQRNVNGDAARWGRKGLAGEDPTNWISQANMLNLEASPFYGELEGGRSIYPQYDHPLSADGAPVWEIEDEEDVKVYAAPMSHGIPCVGYSVEELERPGRLRNEVVEPVVLRNIDALKKAGFRHPMKALAVVKNLLPGTSFTFPDGTVVTQEEAVEAPRQGRKVVICGDTSDSRAMRGLAKDADLVIHEATNSYLAGLDKDSNSRKVQHDTVVHGHSTPTLAGNFAKSVNAKRLVMNHFSARYKGDLSVDSLSIMMRIEIQAMKAAGLNETQVAAAWDLMVLPVPQTS